MVRHIIPSSLNEALKYLSEGTFRIMAGGTDLMIQRRSSAGTPPRFEQDILYLANLSELKYIVKSNGYIHIGSMTKLADIQKSEEAPLLLRKVVSEIGGPAIRHVSTIGGNIGNASPAGDGLVALYLLDAKIVVESVEGERLIPIEEFIVGVRKIVLRPNELIKEIVVPDTKFDYVKWVKVGGRKADSISKVSFAGAYSLKDGVIEDLRLAFGSVSATVARSRALEASCKNHKIAEIKRDLPRILEECGKIISPIDDQRSNKAYRRKVAINIAEHFLKHIE